MKRLIFLIPFVLPILMGVLAFSTTYSIQSVINAAKRQTLDDVTYNGKYVKISYPNGDVPADIGVCTDVIIRAYRTIGVDLQKLIHEDILLNKSEYRLKSVDSNIDHRRIPNMRTFLKRQGAKQKISLVEKDYLPGDLVFWNVAAGHVGIVIDEKVPGTNRFYVVHNIGRGPEKEDFLFRATIVDHYRWLP